MIYGIISGPSEKNYNLLCPTFKVLNKYYNDPFFGFFQYTTNGDVIEFFKKLWDNLFPDKTVCSIRMTTPSFNEGLKQLLFNQDQMTEINEAIEEETLRGIIEPVYRHLKSLYLAIFCSIAEEVRNADRYYFITGDVNFDTGTVREVDNIPQKFDIVKTKVENDRINRNKCEFIYVAKDKISFDEGGAGIAIKKFDPGTSLSEILYHLQNSTVVLKKDKHIYSEIIIDELNDHKEKIKSIDFYFPGDKSSRLLFDTSIFTAIDGIINRNSDFSLNFYTLDYYASEQRMDGQKKIPTWINNFKDNAAKINKINDSLSIFSHNMDPQFGMLIDSIVKTNSKVTLSQFEVDGNAFFGKNYKNRSAIIISYKNEPSWMCYSEVPSFWEENEFEEQSSRICITKTEGQIKDNVDTVQALFKDNLENPEDSLSTEFQPFVLIGFPGTGKTETTKFFARMENIGNDDLEAEKVFSSDDRINNRAYSDNEESKLFRSKFDWAYPSREEAKNRIKQLVKEKYKDKEGDADSLKELVHKLYRDKTESDKVIKERDKAHAFIDENKKDLKFLGNLFKSLYGNEEKIINESDEIENQLKESADKDCQKKLEDLVDTYYINKYREIEYNIRKNQVLDSIDLAWIQHQRLDLGGKEIMEPSVRKNLYLRGYKSILLINAKQPFKEKKDTEGEKDSIEALGLKENSWSCVKQNLNVIEKAENNKYFNAMRDNAFEAYFDEVYEEHPETADEAPRRNIFNLKNEALGGKCKNCERASCDKECEYWTEENIKKFKESLKKDIWDPRFRYYLDYCQEIVVRQKTIEETANMVNSIVGSSEYKSNLVKKIPAAYCNNDSNSFAEYTVKNRFHEIWEAEFKDTNWNEFVEKKKVSDFIKNTRGDLKEYLNNFSDSTLQQFFNNAEFLKSEFFLYHIMKEKWELEKKDIRDLFKLKKQNDWEKKRDDKLIPKLRKIIFQTSSLNKQKIDGYLNYMTTGNAHDLSQRQSYKPKSEDSIKLIYDGITPIEDAENKHIYEEVFSFFNKRKYKRFDFIPDNAGVELFSDYLFALYLLQTNTVEKIVLHLKPFPMFVSDATASDFETLKTIIEGEFPEISTMLTQYESEGRLVIKADEEEFFYVPYFKDCKFVEEIMKAGCELLIVKGDLNYRRLVGDLNWDRTQPIKPIIAPFVTCKCLCLRCIKSDVLLGLTEADAEQVKNTIPPEELPKGKYATIQFI